MIDRIDNFNEFDERWLDKIINSKDYVSPNIRDASQYLLNLEYLFNIYGEYETFRMLKRLEIKGEKKQ